MKNYIEQFSQQLEQALTIAQSATIRPKQSDIRNVVITGLGGSAFGGEIVRNYIAKSCQVPFNINREYDIPAYIGKHTLFITASYSGNTEETLSAYELAVEQGAEIVCITSGGKLKASAEARGYDYIELPKGYPPRAAAGFSVVQQLEILKAYGLIGDYEADLKEAISLVKNFADHEEVKQLAAQMKGKIGVLYSSEPMESIAIRWRQQIAENSKQLAWHHIVPEMNHNELVGWMFPKELMEKMMVLFLESGYDHPRTSLRVGINDEIIRKHTQNVCHIHAKGDSHLGQIFYLLHYGDWLSFYLAEENDIDPVPVKVIDYLKSELAKHP